jgi:hypothetical protein
MMMMMMMMMMISLWLLLWYDNRVYQYIRYLCKYYLYDFLKLNVFQTNQCAYCKYNFKSEKSKYF